MFPFKRRPTKPIDLNAPVDADTAKRVAALVNAGKTRQASKLCATTPDPRATAFLAFRWIEGEEPS